MSTISAGTSNTTSLIYTGDTTGNLMFQTNGTTEAMRVTSQQRVGIGSAAPQSPLEVYGLIRTTGFVANPSSGAGMELAWDGTQGIVQAFSDRTAQTTAPVYFTGGQIKFPATQNASGDANTLDDYEEGTWTPGVGGNATYSVQGGWYTKIGRFVYVTGVLGISNIGNVINTASQVRISNFPFTNFSSGNAQTALNFSYFSGIGVAVYSLGGYMENNLTTAVITGMVAGAQTTTNNGIAVHVNGSTVYFSATYMAT